MLPAKEFFVLPEPVWILRVDRKDDNRTRGDEDESSSKFPIHTSFPRQSYSSHYRNPSPAKDHDYAKGKTDTQGTKKKKETTVVVMKVNMCCGECETTVRVALGELEGVKSVECNWFRKRVTVVATSAAPADILMECRKHFKRSRMWSDDD